MTLTKSQNELLNYLVAQDEMWIERVGAANCGPVTSAEDVVEMFTDGVDSVESYELCEMRNTFSDVYKDVWGVRPRYINPWAMTREELDAEFASLERSAQYEREALAERVAAEAAAVARENELLTAVSILPNPVFA
jgi:hypothetical protein